MIKVYSRCKKSNIEWISDIPYEWEVRPLFSVASYSNESNKGMIEDNLLSLSYGRIVRKNIETLEGLLPESFETYQVVNPNYIVFRLTDLQNDKRSLRSAIVKERGIITSAYIAVNPLKIDPTYFHYLMRSYDETKVFYNLGSGMRQSLRYSELKRLPVVVPPHETQLTIANYLDSETNRISVLIDEKQNFINLLKEKRQALISHVVTKGLDPDVEMKDSGVEWIGEIPIHWSQKRLKHLISLIESGTSVNAANVQAEPDQIGVLKTSSVYGGSFDPNKTKTVIDEDIVRVSCPLKQGALIVSRMNTPDLVGAAGYVFDAPENIFLPDRLWQVEFNSATLPEFVYYWTLTEVYRNQVKISCEGTSSSMQNISQGDFKNYHLAVPSLEE